MTHRNPSILCTLKQLHENTSEIIKDMNRYNCDVVVTRRGRFVARISPLANVDNLEGKMLSKVPTKEVDGLRREADTAYAADEILKMINEGSPPNDE